MWYVRSWFFWQRDRIPRTRTTTRTYKNKNKINQQQEQEPNGVWCDMTFATKWFINQDHIGHIIWQCQTMQWCRAFCIWASRSNGFGWEETPANFGRQSFATFSVASLHREALSIPEPLGAIVWTLFSPYIQLFQPSYNIFQLYQLYLDFNIF